MVQSIFHKINGKEFKANKSLELVDFISKLKGIDK